MGRMKGKRKTEAHVLDDGGCHRTNMGNSKKRHNTGRCEVDGHLKLPGGRKSKERKKNPKCSIKSN